MLRKKKLNQTSTPPTPPTAYNGTSEYLPAMTIRKDEIGHFSICCDKQLWCKKKAVTVKCEIVKNAKYVCFIVEKKLFYRILFSI